MPSEREVYMPANKDEMVKLVVNDSLPTLLVDNLNISTRTDGLFFIRLITNLPEGMKEQARVMVPEQSLKRMLEVLCSQVDHYPSKKKASSKKKPNRKSRKNRA